MRLGRPKADATKDTRDKAHGDLYTTAVSSATSFSGPRSADATGPPSQSWRTFLANHVADLASIDFFTVPTATFRVLLVFVVLSHDRRRIVHLNVTAHPLAEWTAQQLREAWPWDTAPRFVLRDRDDVVSSELQTRRTHKSRHLH